MLLLANKVKHFGWRCNLQPMEYYADCVHKHAKQICQTNQLLWLRHDFTIILWSQLLQPLLNFLLILALDFLTCLISPLTSILPHAWLCLLQGSAGTVCRPDKIICPAKFLFTILQVQFYNNTSTILQYYICACWVLHTSILQYYMCACWALYTYYRVTAQKCVSVRWVTSWVSCIELSLLL